MNSNHKPKHLIWEPTLNTWLRRSNGCKLCGLRWGKINFWKLCFQEAVRLSSILSRGWVCEAEYQWEAYRPKQALNQGSEPEETRKSGERNTRMKELICSVHINYAITPLIWADLDELMLTEAQIYCNDSIFTLTKTTKSICKCNVCCS